MPACAGMTASFVEAPHHPFAFASAISSKIRCGITGVCAIRTPNGASASSTAEITAAAVGIVPASPPLWRRAD